MLHIFRPEPRRTGTRPESGSAGSWGLLALIALGALSLLPWPAGAAPDRNPERAARLANQWEDVLLLDACRYLGLSQQQVRQLVPIARQTDRRVTRLQQDEDRVLASLEQIAGRTRQALLAGQPTADRDAKETARLRQALDQLRAQAAAEVLRVAIPHFVRILTREQLGLAWRLQQGRPPAYAEVGPGLLDPASGFVQTAQGDTIQGVRYRRLRGLQPVPPGAQGGEDTDLDGTVVQAYRRQLLERVESEQARLEAHALAQQRLLEGEDNAPAPQPPGGGAGFMQRVVEAPNPDELGPAVEPICRRLFMSPRWAPVLEEGAAAGLGRGTPGGARVAVPAGPPRVLRYYRLYQGFQDASGQGPALLPQGGQIQNGYYVFGPGQGLRVEEMGVTDHYAIEMVFRSAAVNGYQKLIDFKNGTRDTGLYLYQGRLTFYTLANGPMVLPARDHRLRFERSRANHVVRTFVDGQPAFGFLDLDDEAAFDKGLGHFFMDDKTTSDEEGPGALSWLQVWDRP